MRKLDALLDPRRTVGALFVDPSIRSPLKAVLCSWAARDPIDAAEDAGIRALALERFADERIGELAKAWVERS